MKNKLSKEDYGRDHKYRKSYGISLEEYNLRVKDADECCEICKKHISQLSKRLVVDHNHQTGALRGLLCNNCNSILGMAEDNIQTLLNALDYLSYYK